MTEVIAPAAPAVPAAPRVRKAWDIWLTIGLDLVAVVSWFFGAGISYLGMAFFGSCSSNGCSGQSVIDGAQILIVLAVLGILSSIVFLIIKRRGWPVALITVGVIFFGWIAANLIDVPR